MELESLSKDKYLYYYPNERALVVFDHIRYDRSDIDMITKGQRDHVERKLKSFGYKWSSGRSLASSSQNEIFTIPRQGQLGASIVDVIRYEKQTNQTIFILTPTQFSALCLGKSGINCFSKLREMVAKLPVNIKKLKKEFSAQEDIVGMLSELERFQDQELGKDHLKGKKHLGAFF